MNNDQPPELPALHQGALSWEQVEQLFSDIEICAVLHEVLPRFASRQMVGEPGRLTLTDARELLSSGKARAVQLRYSYNGADWCDTIAAASSEFRVVRIQHDFAAPGEGPAG